MTWCDFFEKLRGWADGEGCFLINRKSVKNSVSYRFRFEIGMHKDDLSLLEFIHTTLGLGSVYTYKDSSHFVVEKLSEIRVIISIFDKFTLNTTKYLNYIDFSKCYTLYIAMSETDLRVLSSIEEIRQGMNSKRTNFTLPETHKLKITPYWLLAFVEGEGSFHVEKNQYFRLVFNITQSMVDIAVLELIQEFLMEGRLQIESSNHVAVGIYKRKGVSKANHKLSAELRVREAGFIREYLIPLFGNLIWHTKKQKDFQDWITILKLKDRGHHYHELGCDLMNSILSQMNNNRLSTVNFNKIQHEDLEFKINNILAAPSNLEIINGRTFILSEQRYLNSGKGKSLNNLISLVNKQDLNESTVRTFSSQAECAKYLGVAESTVSNRLKKGLTFNYSGKLVLLRKEEDATTKKTSSILTKIVDVPSLKRPGPVTSPKPRANPRGGTDVVRISGKALEVTSNNDNEPLNISNKHLNKILKTNLIDKNNESLTSPAGTPALPFREGSPSLPLSLREERRGSPISLLSPVGGLWE